MAIRVLSFFVGGEYFAVDAEPVREVVRRMEVTPVHAAPDEVAGIANLRGTVVTVLNVPVLLELGIYPSRLEGPHAENVLVFKDDVCGGERMGFIIDKPDDLLEIDVGDLPASGSWEVEGMPCRIVDVNSIIGRFRD